MNPLIGTVTCSGVHPGDSWDAADLIEAQIPPVQCTRPGRRVTQTEHYDTPELHPMLRLIGEDATRGRTPQVVRAVEAVLSVAMKDGTDAEVRIESRDPRYPDLLIQARWNHPEPPPVKGRVRSGNRR